MLSHSYQASSTLLFKPICLYHINHAKFELPHNQLILTPSSFTNVFPFATAVYSAVMSMFFLLAPCQYIPIQLLRSALTPIRIFRRENKNITRAFSVTSIATHFNMNFPIYKQYEQVVDLWIRLGTSNHVDWFESRMRLFLKLYLQLICVALTVQKEHWEWIHTWTVRGLMEGHQFESSRVQKF
jgi:hypothetical protein